MSKILSLTTIEDIMTYPGMSTISDPDKEWIGRLAASFSQRAETYCSRHFYEESRSQQFTSDGTLRQIQLSAFGADTNALTKVEQDASRVFGPSTEIDLSNFYFDWRTGVFVYEFGPFIRGLAAIKVTWTGGLGTDVEHVPEDLRAAATMQVAFWWQRRHELGINQRDFEKGSSIKIAGGGSLLPDVEAILQQYQIYAAS